MEQVLYKGIQVNVGRYGEGHTLVLLHGFLESSSIWNPFIDQLSQFRQVIVPDLPGHGKTACFAEVHTMEEMAGMVNAILEKWDVQKCEIIGHSMGGYVSLAFLELFPSKVTSLTLLNSTPLPDNAEKRSVRERSDELLRQNNEAYVRMAISNLFSPWNRVRYSSEGAMLVQEALKFPMEGITAAIEGMKIRTNRKPVLQRFRGDKMLLAGREDSLIPFLTIKEIARDTGCEFHGLSGGHLYYIEAKDEITNLCISSKK